MKKTQTLNIKLDKEEESRLNELAYRLKKSKGQLVRDALQTCYQTSLANLPAQQVRALNAYQGGYISIGKLASEMGMQVLELRKWLRGHDIARSAAFNQLDDENA
jgi:hypothetical protein